MNTVQARWLLQATRIAYHTGNAGLHIRIPTQRGVVQWWPTTSRMMHPRAFAGRPCHPNDLFPTLLK